MTDPGVTHHNPGWIIRAAGHAPVVTCDLQTGWMPPHLLALFAAANLTARHALRVGRLPGKAMGLTAPGGADDTPMDALIAHPFLVNRPFACTPKGVRLCRPSEAVLDLLDRLPTSPLAKEDGQIIIDAEGNRLV